jgi:hypothetical protein
MPLPRRQFLASVAAAIAAATGVNGAAKAVLPAPAEPLAEAVAVPPMARKTTSIAEFARHYMGADIKPWQEDVLTEIKTRKLTANVMVPACLLEDSPIDIRGQVSKMISESFAETFDFECW